MEGAKTKKARPAQYQPSAAAAARPQPSQAAQRSAHPGGRGGGAGAGSSASRGVATKDDEDDEEDDDEDDEDDVESDTDADSSATDSDDSEVLNMARKGVKDEGDEDEDGDDDDEEDDGAPVSVSFVFVDPSEIDFKSVRRLLAHYLPGEEDTFDAGGMADAIIAQRGGACTMVKVEGDLDVYSFATLLPVAQHRTAPWMKSVRAYLLRKCKDEGAKKRLEALFDAPDSGAALFVNERVVNMPPELAPPLQEALVRDLEAARKAAAGKAPLYDFKHLIMVSPCWTEKATPQAVEARQQALSDAREVARLLGGGGKKGGAAGAAAAAASAAAVAASSSSSSSATVDERGMLTHFYRFEEEVYADAAVSTFSFPVAADENVTLVPAGAGAASSSSSAAGAGKKRKAGADAPGEEEDGETRRNLRAPQVRRVLVVPAAAIQPSVRTIRHLLEVVQQSVGAAGSQVAAFAAASAAGRPAKGKGGSVRAAQVTGAGGRGGKGGRR